MWKKEVVISYYFDIRSRKILKNLRINWWISALTAARMKWTVFWDAAPCRLVQVYLRSEVLAARIITSLMEAAGTSEMYVNLYQTIRRNNPEDSHLQKKTVSGLRLEESWSCIQVYSAVTTTFAWFERWNTADRPIFWYIETVYFHILTRTAMVIIFPSHTVCK
jgi:hypothetical protein